ncbi:GTP-binding protein [Paenibacillus sp. N3/727]|uniref:CobW family GTP-binding protein n=1 Tax=Paenibacillus sp. N3/727 TaxID=2925845 RepID=UPI001F536F44|nr:GTP-binding protein [Paenibacillus sp. N3/727]UNK16622.1 GTP-binding protein [Paenibacillus sp. N3/727]
MKNGVTPIYILSGFLGSGKTTLLTRMIAYWKQQGLKPAIVMNEIGEVNIDGMIAGEDVPTAEMLSGCICCSIRADLSSEIAMLIQNEKPDVIVIEATGAANPMEILDAVAEASLYINIDVKNLITVVDSAHLLHLHEVQKGKTYRLMQEQIRCASTLILNKIDRINEEEQQEAARIVRGWNAVASMIPAVRCDVNPDVLLEEVSVIAKDRNSDNRTDTEVTEKHHAPDNEHNHDHTHDHVMSFTYYFKGPVNSNDFEALVAGLPREIYRAKGILTFNDTASRFLFQYAYRESDFMKINPQGQLSDVVVFIGEHFSKTWIKEQLVELEAKAISQESR